MHNLMRLLIATLLSVASVGSAPVSVHAQIAEATTNIDGLTCPFCAFGAKKRLKTVAGVDQVEVDVGQGIATLQAKPGQSIDVQQIPAAIQKAGFSPGAIRVVATGQVKREGETLHLYLDEQGSRLQLEVTDAEQQNQLLTSINQAIDQGQQVEVTGRWSKTEADPDAKITPESIKAR